MPRTILSLFVALLFSATSAIAQSSDDIVWVQLEAQPSLTQASENIRSYAQRMDDVNGFTLGGGWYAVALGPYLSTDAENVLGVYRAEGVIPVDAYLATAREYRSQFWPVGTNQLTNPQAALSGQQPVQNAAQDTDRKSVV